jgi:hypothetical protein
MPAKAANSFARMAFVTGASALKETIISTNRPVSDGEVGLRSLQGVPENIIEKLYRHFSSGLRNDFVAEPANKAHAI